MQLFFNSNINSETKIFTFDKIESKHIVRVLRKKEGDVLKITNGKRLLFDAKIISANDKKCSVEIINSIKKEKSWNYHLHIAVAPTKNNDRFEWFLEKATEIGIDEITPIVCKNSERKLIKEERFEKIILSALKQSLKFTKPKLNKLTSFSEFIKSKNDSEIYIAHCSDVEKDLLSNVVKPKHNITILIGPEGDFNKEEIELALKNNATSISLGESRLRTETAALVAVTTVSLFSNFK